MDQHRKPIPITGGGGSSGMMMTMRKCICLKSSSSERVIDDRKTQIFIKDKEVEILFFKICTFDSGHV